MSFSGNISDYKIAVVCGGKSGEREVSLNSGAACAQALEAAGAVVEKIDPVNKDDLVKLADGEFDVAFLALHGRGGEDGTIQGFLETLGIPYTGSGVLASAQAYDKSKAKEVYAAAGLPIADSLVIEAEDVFDQEDLDEIADRIGIPCVVKPATEGSSLGMTIVRDAANLQAAFDTALAVDEKALVESFIEGTELTIGIIGNDDPQALPVIQIVPTEDEFYNFHAKYAAGGSKHICPAQVDKNIYDQAQNIALAAHGVLGCKGVSRSDVIVDAQGECWLLETNTLPGMTSTSLVPDAARVAGMDFSALCVRLIELALED